MTDKLFEELEKKYRDYLGVEFKDALTGMFNHGFFLTFLAREIERSQRYGLSFTLAMIDIDAFSDFNRLKGPLQGDQMLHRIANAIEADIRSVDVAARFSGDIFVLLMPHLNKTSALGAVGRIQQATLDATNRQLSISIGLATFPDDAEDRDSLLSTALEAVNKAKLSGRSKIFQFADNRPVVSTDDATVLIVDDDPRNLKLLAALLRQDGYRVISASSGNEALHLLVREKIDLVVLDLMMPGMDGFEVCRRLKDNEQTRMLPVILLTALDDSDTKIRGIEAGADDFITKPPNKAELLARTRSLIKMRRLNKNLTNIENVLFSLANTVEAKDPYTQGHISRVSGLAVALGKRMRLSATDIEALRYGGALHDIGKIGVSSAVLNKPGPLDPEELRCMQQHAIIGYQICKPLRSSLGSAVEVVRYHHEKLDGSGYPDGLKGNSIPLVARIMAVADIYDALVTDRPYRAGMSKEKALDIISREMKAGKLDEQVVRQLLELINRPSPAQPDTPPLAIVTPAPGAGAASSIILQP